MAYFQSPTITTEHKNNKLSPFIQSFLCLVIVITATLSTTISSRYRSGVVFVRRGPNQTARPSSVGSVDFIHATRSASVKDVAGLPSECALKCLIFSSVSRSPPPAIYSPETFQGMRNSK